MYRRTAIATLSVIMTATSAFSQSETPMSADEHTAQAIVYERRIAELQGDVVQHRHMKSEYARTTVQIPKAPRNPWIVRMDKHCDEAVQQLRVLIAEYERMAEHHRFRAIETLTITTGTAAEYDGRAAHYSQRAAEYRKQAAEHRAMQAQFQPRPIPKGLSPDSAANKEMRAHCQRIIAAAEALATSSERFAEIFAALAEEQRGK